MSTIKFGNPILGHALFSTEHSASSYGIPVLVDECGNAYGHADSIRPTDDPLGWIHPEIQTAGDLVRKFALAEYNSMEPRSNYDARIAVAKLFLGAA